MAPPIRSAANPNQSHGFAADPPGQHPPSNNLWIGNVAAEVSDAELKALLEMHGRVDSVTTYPSRNYAFVYFTEVDGAKSAKQGLQGHILRGHALKIEFAKPAKPCKSLWVAGISPSVAKEDLEKDFLRFGKIQEFRFLKDRNTAYVDYIELEDATQALRNMNGKRVGGAPIRVDYLRSQSSRREQGPDAKEGQFPGRNMGASDFRWMGQDSLNNYSEPSILGPKRKSQFPPVGPQYGDAPLSKVLWIRHPPSVIIEEDMLHNAMILFGEIERIKTFSGKSYAFVEFRSVEEARRAKEGLQGKLFNDPRISIDYWNNEFPFPAAPMDVLGLNLPGLLGNNPVRPPSFGIREPDLYTRPPIGPHSSFEPALHGAELIDMHKPGHQSLLGGPTWRRSSPTPGADSSLSPSSGVPNRSASSWDVFDSNHLQRESKRSRFDAALLPQRTENQGLDEQYGPRSLTRGASGGLGQRHVESDCIWRGLIAKGGTPVCRARCVPVGDGLDVEIPDVVNCSARTGLDLLSKHYDDAIGFSIVFFLPDSEEDFASYTEFLRYLGSKDRAGVAKFDDGTTLFLVPPSDFLTKVLKVSGPERLYGVVLKFPQVVPRPINPRPVPVHPNYADPPKMPTLHSAYSSFPKEERVFPYDNSRVSSEDLKLPPKIPLPVSSSYPAQPVPPTTAAPQTGFSLTPELIATLTSFLPSNNGSSGSQTASLPHNPSILGGAQSNVNTVHDTNASHWKNEHLQQLGSQINSHLQHLQESQAAPIIPKTTNSPYHQTLNSYHHPMHDHTMKYAPQGAAAANSSKPMPPVIPFQSGPVSMAPQEMNQHYQQGGGYQDYFRGQGIDNESDAHKFYNPSAVQQQPYIPLSSQSHANGVSQPHPYIMPMPSEVDPSQPSQTAPFGSVQQEIDETEADKNERYKTTLLFAANLLSQIHQPSGNRSGQGAGSH
ncbi:hypothetical protein ABFS83_07G088900 [Erythranthe nasuta]